MVLGLLSIILILTLGLRLTEHLLLQYCSSQRQEAKRMSLLFSLPFTSDSPDLHSYFIAPTANFKCVENSSLPCSKRELHYLYTTSVTAMLLGARFQLDFLCLSTFLSFPLSSLPLHATCGIRGKVDISNSRTYWKNPLLLC